MIVFDSSTLILLAKIDLLNLFVSHFQGDIIIPWEVKEEIYKKRATETLLIEEFIKERKIKINKVQNKDQTDKLITDFHIDKGEAEAIVLAIQKGAGIIATDDRNAIKACKLLRLDFVTAITFLIRACEKGLIDRDRAIQKLKKLQLYGRYSNEIINDAIEKIQGVSNGYKDT